MALRGRSRIKRFPLPMVSRSITVDDSGWGNTSEEYTFEYQVAENCTIQPIKADELNIALEGITSDRSYTVYTDSFLSAGLDGSNYLGHSIYLPDGIFGFGGNGNITGVGGWYTVIKPQIWGNESINHCKAYIVKDNTLTSDSGILQYPQTEIEIIVDDIQTKSNLRDGLWEAIWLANNTP